MIYRKFLHVILILSILLTVSGCKQDSSNVPWVEVYINLDEAKTLQSEVDNGHRVGEMDPVQVAHEFLNEKLNIREDINEHKEIKAGEGEKGYRLTPSDGRIVEVILFQPVRTDSTGIWVVKKYRFLNK